MQQHPSNFSTSFFHHQALQINKELLLKHSDELNNTTSMQPSPQTTVVGITQKPLKIRINKIINPPNIQKEPIIIQPKLTSVETQTDPSWFQEKKLEKEIQTIQFSWKDDTVYAIKHDASQKKNRNGSDVSTVGYKTAQKLFQMQKMRHECLNAINYFDKIRLDKEDLQI